ncbi:hypothetical protein JCM10207_001428 [Rhodosporidiobolus poonsookiae]
MMSVARQIAIEARKDELASDTRAWSDGFDAAITGLSTTHQQLPRQDGVALLEELKALQDRVYADGLTVAQLGRRTSKTLHALGKAWDSWLDANFSDEADSVERTAYRGRHWEPFALRAHEAVSSFPQWDEQARSRPRKMHSDRRAHLETLYRGVHRACLEWQPDDIWSLRGSPEQIRYSVRQLGEGQFEAYAQREAPLVPFGVIAWTEPHYDAVVEALRSLIRLVKEKGGAALDWVAPAHTSHSHPFASHSFGQLHHRQQRI